MAPNSDWAAYPICLLLAPNRSWELLARSDPQDAIQRFGDGGRQPGQFFGVHSVAIDSKGNLYTTETWEGKRLQKFVFRGIGTVPRQQGTIRPGT